MQVGTLVRRLVGAVAALGVLTFAGSLGYYALGGGRWGFGDCVYMTFISVTTVGFGELPGLHDVPGARALTGVLIAGGVGALAYVQANVTAILVEGVIGNALRRNRMKKLIEALKDHVVVAGGGSTGRHVIEELVATKTAFVLIEGSQEVAARLNRDFGGSLLYVIGDATDDQALLAANVKQARGVVAALTHDKDNLFVTLSARSLNSQARIVSKIVDDSSAAKMLRAGATTVVSPTQIGGRRMASEIIRPQVAQFLDHMLREKEQNLRLEQIEIVAGAPAVGRALRDIALGKDMRALVVAIRLQADGDYMYNPEPDFMLEPGMLLVAMGDSASLAQLRARVAG